MDSEKELILKNKYRIIKQIGKGAMGHVYLAESLENDREFAVKKLEISSETGLNENMAKEIFSKEVKFLSRFNHRGLPKFQEIFVENNSHYLIMEYIKGRTLEEIINSGERVEERRAIKWIIEIGEILNYLHNSFESPIVYRDLKPANIIITPADTPRLIDFGISRYYNPDKNTDTFRLGSPGYAAPEQYKGRGQSGPQTDVFSMGVILYELLTGYDPTVTPFKFPPMKTLNPSLSDELVKIVSRAVELRALKRYISVLEFKEDLEKYHPPSSTDTDLKVIPQRRIVRRKASVRFAELFSARDLVPFIQFAVIFFFYSIIIINKAPGLNFSIIIFIMFIALIIRFIFYNNLLVAKFDLYF
ncbi:serine/threonine protein kinase, partial [Candidatus Parcubacteria bacterium]